MIIGLALLYSKSVLAWHKNLPFYTIGAKSFKLVDQGHSPWIYQGLGIYGGGEKQALNKQWFKGIGLHYGWANLKPKLADQHLFFTQNVPHHELNFNGVIRRKCFEYANQLYAYIGGAMAVDLTYVDFKNKGNNPIGYEATASINPAIAINYLASAVSVFFTIDASLLSYTLRPKYKGFFPTENGEVTLLAILKNGGLQSVGRLCDLHMRTMIGSQHVLPKQNLMLYYDYKGGYNKRYETKAYAEHSLGLIFWLNVKSASIQYICPTE